MNNGDSPITPPTAGESNPWRKQPPFVVIDGVYGREWVLTEPLSYYLVLDERTGEWFVNDRDSDFEVPETRAKSRKSAIGRFTCRYRPGASEIRLVGKEAAPLRLKSQGAAEAAAVIEQLQCLINCARRGLGENEVAYGKLPRGLAAEWRPALDLLEETLEWLTRPAAAASAAAQSGGPIE